MSSQFSYNCFKKDRNLPVVVTPPFIYHCCSTWETLWEENITGEEKLFSAVSMKNCGRNNVRRNKEIKGSDKYVTLDISLKFDNMYKMKITSSDSKEKLERSGKQVDYLSGFQGQSKIALIQKGKLFPRK